MEAILEFIKPEVIVIIPVIYFIGACLKASEYKDKLMNYIK